MSGLGVFVLAHPDSAMGGASWNINKEHIGPLQLFSLNQPEANLVFAISVYGFQQRGCILFQKLVIFFYNFFELIL